VLLEAHLKEPTNDRHVFYLAQSYRDANEPIPAIKFYEKRISMQGWEEEVFTSMVEVAHLKSQLKYPLEEVIAEYKKAHEYRPSRVEPLYYLAYTYRQHGDYERAYVWSKKALLLEQPTSDILFVHRWIEEYGALFELSISAYYVGFYEESYWACEVLLHQKKCTAATQDLIRNNQQFSLKKMLTNKIQQWPLAQQQDK